MPTYYYIENARLQSFEAAEDAILLDSQTNLPRLPKHFTREHWDHPLFAAARAAAKLHETQPRTSIDKDDAQWLRLRSEQKQRYAPIYHFLKSPDFAPHFLQLRHDWLVCEKLADPTSVLTQADVTEMRNHEGYFIRRRLDGLMADLYPFPYSGEPRAYMRNLVQYHGLQGNAEALHALTADPALKRLCYTALAEGQAQLLHLAMDGKPAVGDWAAAVWADAAFHPRKPLSTDIRDAFLGYAVTQNHGILLAMLDPQQTLRHSVTNAPIPPLKLPHVAVSYDAPPRAPKSIPDSGDAYRDQLSRFVENIGFFEGFPAQSWEIDGLMRLFPDADTAIHYLRKQTAQFLGSIWHRKPALDAMRLFLPENDVSWQPREWGKLLLQHGEKIFELLPNAPKIERCIAEENAALLAQNRSFQYELTKLSLDQLYGFASTAYYRLGDQDTALAHACTQHRPYISQERFDVGRQARLKISKRDNIPDIGIIDGAAIGFPGFYMRKLAKNDPRLLLTGREVDCCAHLNHKDGYKMALAGVTSPDGGCYALFEQLGPAIDLQNDPLRGKTHVWRAKPTGTARRPYSNLGFNGWYSIGMKDMEKMQDPGARSQALRLVTMGEIFMREAARTAIKVAATTPDMEPVRRIILIRANAHFPFQETHDIELPRDSQTALFDRDSYKTQYEILNLDQRRARYQLSRQQSGAAALNR